MQLAVAGRVVRIHPARHDPAKEHGAFATPKGRPRKKAGVVAVPVTLERSVDIYVLTTTRLSVLQDQSRPLRPRYPLYRDQ